MAKHNHESNVGVADQVEVKTDEPRVKVGDKVEAVNTSVDSPAKEKTPRVITPRNVKYRILDGVDASKFAGQRGHVIRSLQKLSATHGSDAAFTVEQIVSHVEGLVSRTPIEASVKFHLAGMVKDGQVQQIVPEPVVTEKAA